jgi:hypothetical protein
MYSVGCKLIVLTGSRLALSRQQPDGQAHLLPHGETMFLTIALVLIVLWALGFFIFPVVGGLVHILLIIAVIAIIWHFIKGRSTTPRV